MLSAQPTVRERTKVNLSWKSILILVPLFLIAMIGSAFVTAYYLSPRSASDTEGAAGEAERVAPALFDPALVWDAGAVTVNLATPGGAVPRYVRAAISFEVSERRVVTQLETRRVQVRDRVIGVLRTTSFEELSDAEGISRLKERIKDAVNALIAEEDGRINAVYLTEFVVQ